jgi:hypothetical protein
MMSKQFQVTVTGQSAELFQKVFGSATVAVQFPFPVLADLPIGEQLVYLLDLREISDEQRARMVDHLAAEHDLDRAFVEDRIAEQGVPILAREAIMMTSVPLTQWVDDAPDDYLDYWAEITADDEVDNAPPTEPDPGWPGGDPDWNEFGFGLEDEP